jgi:CheY-like chemotaxis protein
MDLSLPSLSGIQATTVLKNHADTKGISVVAVSAHCGDARWREMALQLGCENCIAKPIDFAKLAPVLERYIEDEGTDSVFNKRTRRAE